MESPNRRKVIWSGEGEWPKAAKKAAARNEIKPQLATPEALRLREKLGFIDFSVLRSIFSDMYKRYGHDPAHMNFFELDSISPSAGMSVACYRAEENELGINIDCVDRIASENIDLNIAIAETLCHEETHALGRVECQFTPERTRKPFRKSGYAIEVDKPLSEASREIYGLQNERLFDGFNEGVTELIAYEVLSEYTERTGQFSKEDVQSFVEVRRQIPEVVLATEFISRLAKRSNFSYEETELFVKESYFKDSNFLEEMHKSYPDLTRGSGYMAWLANEGAW